MSIWGRRRRGGPPPADGWWWVRPLSPTPDNPGREWRVARVAGGTVQPHGTTAWYAPIAPGLRDAEWVRADPPVPGTAAVRPMIASGWADDGFGPAEVGNRVASGRPVLVAAVIVDAFLAVHRSAADYYDRHPGHKGELEAEVARLVASVRR